MVRSMTGFGRAEKVFGGMEVTVEIKSVNHQTMMLLKLRLTVSLQTDMSKRLKALQNFTALKTI